MVLHFEEGGSFKAWLKGLKRAPRQPELDTHRRAPARCAGDRARRRLPAPRHRPRQHHHPQGRLAGPDRLRLGARRDRLALQDGERARQAGLQPLRAVRHHQPPAGPVDRHLRARRHALPRASPASARRMRPRAWSTTSTCRPARRRSAPTARRSWPPSTRRCASRSTERPQSIADWRARAAGARAQARGPPQPRPRARRSCAPARSSGARSSRAAAQTVPLRAARRSARASCPRRPMRRSPRASCSTSSRPCEEPQRAAAAKKPAAAAEIRARARRAERAARLRRRLAAATNPSRLRAAEHGHRAAERPGPGRAGAPHSAATAARAGVEHALAPVALARLQAADRHRHRQPRRRLPGQAAAGRGARRQPSSRARPPTSRRPPA